MLERRERGRLNYLVYGRRVGLKPSRVKASPQWGVPPDQLTKQLKDGTEAAKEAIEHVTETLHRIQKVKHELANEWMADCITLLEQRSPLDRRMERDLWAPRRASIGTLAGLLPRGSRTPAWAGVS